MRYACIVNPKLAGVRPLSLIVRREEPASVAPTNTAKRFNAFLWSCYTRGTRLAG